MDSLAGRARGVKRAVLRRLEQAERLVAPVGVAIQRESDTLVTFLMHGVFRDEAELALDRADPQQRMTTEALRTLIGYFQESGYRFVFPRELDALPRGGRFAMLTFDDGYWSNLRILPVLEETGAPAVLFSSTNHVREQRSFWWDVVYREGRKAGKSPAEVLADQGQLKDLPWQQIDARLLERYGPKALKPVADVDRPMTIAELKDFAAHPLIELGNHTADHAILTTCDASEVERQIHTAQEDIEAWTGVRPSMISYPNGNHGPREVELATRLGLRWGIMRALSSLLLVLHIILML